MSYKIIVRPEAQADLLAAYRWYEKHSEGLGREFLRSVEASLYSIQRNPKIYQKVHKNIYRSFIRRFPYGVLYLVDGEHIVVLAVLHARRDPQQWQKRT